MLRRSFGSGRLPQQRRDATVKVKLLGDGAFRLASLRLAGRGLELASVAATIDLCFRLERPLP